MSASFNSLLQHRWSKHTNAPACSMSWIVHKKTQGIAVVAPQKSLGGGLRRVCFMEMDFKLMLLKHASAVRVHLSM